MLDIEIFYLEQPITDNGKVATKVPHFSIGQFAALEDETTNKLHSYFKSLRTEDWSFFRSQLYHIGSEFFAADLIKAKEKTTSPFAHKQIDETLKQVGAPSHLSTTQLHAAQTARVNALHYFLPPEYMVAVLLHLYEDHQEEKEKAKDNRYGLDPVQEEIFARGFAKIVQSIRDLPENQKSPLIQRLSRRSTHRWQKVPSNKMEPTPVHTQATGR